MECQARCGSCSVGCVHPDLRLHGDDETGLECAHQHSPQTGRTGKKSSCPPPPYSHIRLFRLCKLCVVHAQRNVGHVLLLYLPNKQGSTRLCLDKNVFIMLTDCHYCATFVNITFLVG